MSLCIPDKIGFDVEIHSKAAAGDWLGVCIEFYSRYLVNEFVKDLPKFGEFGELSDLLRVHLVECLPTELFFLFEARQHVIGYLLELAKRVHARPHTFIHHLGGLKGYLSGLSPASLQTYFEQ